MGGAFNPVHSQHVAIMIEAKKFLESFGGGTVYKVVGGCMGPAPDGYVQRKMQKKGELVISGEHRVAMCNLAIKDVEWMKPSDRTFGSGIAAAKHIFPKKDIVVVVGADRAVRKGRGKWIGRNDTEGVITTLCIGRPGEAMDELHKAWGLDYSVIRNGYAIAPPIATKDVSSTLVRHLLKTIQDLQDLEEKKKLIMELLVDPGFMHTGTSDYLLANQILQTIQRS